VVGADRVTAEHHAAVELARLCSHIPLAICVAAERIAAHPQHMLADLVADLSAEACRLDLLTSGDDHTLAVRTVFSWSYQALHAELARLFRLLGVHRGPLISVDSAAALAGIDHTHAYQLLDELCVAHLIERSGNGHYRLHDLLRLYATELTNTIDSTEIRLRAVSRLVRWYLLSVDAACRALTPNRPHIAPAVEVDDITPLSFASYPDALDWCDVQVQNIALVCTLAVDFGLYAEGWRLPVALLDYLLVRNPWSVWMSTHVIGLDSAIRCDDPFGQGWVVTNLGEAHRRQGDLLVAQDHFERALALCRDHAGRIGQAWALAGLAFVALDRGETETATGHLNEMITLCRDRDYPFGEATGLASLSEARRRAGHPDQALDHAQRSLRIFERLDDTPGRAYALVRMGRALLTRGEPVPAGRCLAHAIALHQEAGDSWAAADALVEHGHLLLDTGHEQEGLSCWHAALKDFEVIDQRRAADLRHRIGILS
jgi:tetratricopeptide (TPR) repeat protein